MLPPQPGRKEPRYAHLFCGDVEEPATTAAGGSMRSAAGTDVGELSRQIEALQDQVHTLEQRFDAFVEQFE
jgi:uncharacterized protein YceH (UPF0502 family)